MKSFMLKAFPDIIDAPIIIGPGRKLFLLIENQDYGNLFIELSEWLRSSFEQAANVKTDDTVSGWAEEGKQQLVCSFV
jgi:hypothetical protein